MSKPAESIFLVQFKGDCLTLWSKGRLVLHHHSDLWIVFNSSDNQNASRRSLKVNGTKSTVGRFVSAAFVHMTDKQNGTVIFFCDSSELCHHITDFIGVVHIDIGTDICLYRIKDYHPCTDFYDCFFNALIQHTECCFRFVYDFDLRTVCLSHFQSRLYGIFQSVLGSLIDNLNRLTLGIVIGQRLSF